MLLDNSFPSHRQPKKVKQRDAEGVDIVRRFPTLIEADSLMNLRTYPHTRTPETSTRLNGGVPQMTLFLWAELHVRKIGIGKLRPGEGRVLF